jgi:hypothetical protein
MAGSLPVIPTGYEGLQSRVDNKRKIADALLAQGLQAHNDFISPFQLLGQLGQVWAGKSLQKDADKAQVGLNDQRVQAYKAKAAEAAADLKGGMSLADFTAKWGADPVLAGTPFIKGTTDAFSAGLTQEQKNKADIDKDRQYRKDPIQLKDAQGNPITAQFDATGNNPTPLAGGLTLPPKIENVNGVALDLQNTKPGTLLPADPNDLVVRPGTPNNNYAVNTPAVEAKSAIAGAGAMKAPDTKVIVNNSDTFGKGSADILDQSRAAAAGAAQSYNTIQNLRKALGTGKVTTGPGTGAILWTQRLLGIGKDKLAETRTAIQGLAQLVLNARGQLKGQGSVSDNEGKLLERATSDGIDSMSPAEILTVLNTTDRVNKWILGNHERLMSNARKIPGAQDYLPMYEVPNPYNKGGSGSTGGSSLADRARAELERRKGGGSGATPSRF